MVLPFFIRLYFLSSGNSFDLLDGYKYLVTFRIKVILAFIIII